MLGIVIEDKGLQPLVLLGIVIVRRGNALRDRERAHFFDYDDDGEQEHDGVETKYTKTARTGIWMR